MRFFKKTKPVEPMRIKIERRREAEAERDKQIHNQCVTTKKMLESFPIGFPASTTEIALAYNHFIPTMQNILNDLVSEEAPSWEYVMVDGCTQYQRIK